MKDKGTTKNQVTQISRLASSIAVLVLLSAPAGFAQYKSSDAAAKPSASADTKFATEAAQGGIAEVKLGQLAEEKGTTQQVKDFGKRMVNDHTKAGDQLKSAVSSENMALPNNMSASDKANYDHLSKLSGTAFDKAYAEDMVKVTRRTSVLSSMKSMTERTRRFETSPLERYPRRRSISRWRAT